MTILSPCPFCGAAAEIDPILKHPSFRVECRNIKRCSAQITSEIEDVAIKQWNRSSQRPQQIAMDTARLDYLINSNTALQDLTHRAEIPFFPPMALDKKAILIRHAKPLTQQLPPRQTKEKLMNDVILHALLELETSAHYIFDTAAVETPQGVRDAIEWYAASIRSVLIRADAKWVIDLETGQKPHLACVPRYTC